MIIERATGSQLLLPSHISGSEVENIAFAYHVIVKGSFYWPLKTIQIFIPATEEKDYDLPISDQPTTYVLPQKKVDRYILGKSIELGYEQIKIEDGLVLDIDKVMRELAKNDGHLVEVVLISLSDRAKYDISGAPQLPPVPWDKNIESLIRLESELDTRLAHTYHELASATFSGLSEEQISGVTARPHIDSNSLWVDAE